jgi:NAD(P)-dependent dehydrogenase (short-subunit alcohol dehydrogenase family)
MTETWTTDEMPDLAGETVVVTGANSGIGLEAARAFARAGALVVMACRNEERAAAAAGAIRADVAGASLAVEKLDLAALASVRAFADRVDAAYGEIRVLCNNAGVMAVPRRETADGFETQFGVNHLGHYALTGLLLPRLIDASGESRVVTQSSGVHEVGTVDFEDLMGERDYGKWDAYAQSKLANLLFAYELDRRLRANDVDVLSVGCHPGYADTNLQQRGPEMEGSTLRGAAMRVANSLLAQSPTRGALPMLYAATAPDVEGGDYVGPDGPLGMRGHPERVASSGASHSRRDARRLWAVSADLTGVDYGLDRPTAASAR